MNPRYLILKLLVLIVLRASSSRSAGLYGTCNGAFSCGTVSGFRYPFRRHQDPAYCGYPGFELNCDERNPPTIEIMKIMYRILGVDPTNQILTVVREDMVNSICPEELVNTTIDHTLFDYTSGYMNISFLFGCPFSFDLVGFGSIFCGKDEVTSPVFLMPGIQAPGICETSVIIPVPVGFMNPTGLGQVIKKGFEIIWKVGPKPCTDCTQSGGQCIYDSATSLTSCACLELPFLVDTCSTKNKTGAASSPTSSSLSLPSSGFRLMFSSTYLLPFEFIHHSLHHSSISSQSNPTTMKPRIHPNPALVVFTVIVALVVRFPAIRCQGTSSRSRYDACGQTVECGDERLEYPFYGSTRPAYCGRPGFQLTCESDVLLLNYESVDYRVLRMDRSTQIITVARNDLWVNSCPQYLHNTTYNSTLFNDDNFGQENVSLYYRCNSTLGTVPFLEANRFDCDVNRTTTDSYFIRTSLVDNSVTTTFQSVQCNNHITVPVNQTWANQLGTPGATTTQLRSALTAGFNLTWTADKNDCDRCVRSNGRCGSNSTSPESFACYCASGEFPVTCNNLDESGGGSKKGSVGIILGVVGAILVVVGVLCAIFVCRRKRKRRAIKEASPNQTETKAILTIDSSKLTTDTTQSNFTTSIPSYPSSKSSKDFAKSTYFGAQVFSYEELEVATDNFNASRELGDGGFGTVYYGKLLDGREVAVKRLYENNFKRVEQFMNEVAILMGLDHVNLVKLYGCTSKRSKELLLVYEYIPNGTVADHLHGKLANSNSRLFSWSVRLNIAIETAEALAYLHKKDIIHRDVKTNNILLDKSFRVKVADFGLSRLFPNDATHVSTAPQGTPGYVDPEYYQCYQLTDKSDVYSFGVVLFELISSLQAVDTNRHRLDINLATMAMTKIQNHLLDELVDKSIGFESDVLVRRMATLVAELGFRCVQQEKDMRPTMKEVVETLRGIQNDEMNAQKPEVLDIVVDDGGVLMSPEFKVTNKLVDGSVPNSSDGYYRVNSKFGT
ncbi:hypothetical protein OSB04_007354 [Centaurea solstitialis]|uniref:non-specific serine/threonine protein kinase n=1 Tax=Centaurea solstitialis TaxID=347529 RepID=A0AA38TLF3_9ASTR|nr:hypothetical protein OSB04_007354 [Centaurea solstitialis]